MDLTADPTYIYFADSYIGFPALFEIIKSRKQAKHYIYVIWNKPLFKFFKDYLRQYTNDFTIFLVFVPRFSRPFSSLYIVASICSLYQGLSQSHCLKHQISRLRPNATYIFSTWLNPLTLSVFSSSKLSSIGIVVDQECYTQGSLLPISLNLSYLYISLKSFIMYGPNIVIKKSAYRTYQTLNSFSNYKTLHLDKVKCTRDLPKITSFFQGIQYNAKVVVILNQPLVESNRLSYDNMNRFYSCLVDLLKLVISPSNIFFKEHPRSKLEYSSLADLTSIPSHIPSEIIEYPSNSIYMTFSSTSAISISSHLNIISLLKLLNFNDQTAQSTIAINFSKRCPANTYFPESFDDLQSLLIDLLAK